MTLYPDRIRAPIEALARQSGFPEDAVETMLGAVLAGGGHMAQFDHPAFGGSGQWMRGGMLMIPDFSNHALKERIGRLCDALADWVATEPAVAGADSFQVQRQTSDGVTRVQDSRRGSDSSPSRWWPADLGTPDTSGAQDGMRYAWFETSRRLVIDADGRITTYDTGDHRIGGVSQQQGGSDTVSFRSQNGSLDLRSLPVVDSSSKRTETRAVARNPDIGHGEGQDAHAAQSAADPFAALERLADLHARGVLDAAEFAAKKAELLKRI
jgi:hypothetical protein